MGKHMRKLFSVNEVKKTLERYLSQEITVEHALAMLKIRRRQFFKLLKYTGRGQRALPSIHKEGTSSEDRCQNRGKDHAGTEERDRDHSGQAQSGTVLQLQLCERDPGEEAQSACSFPTIIDRAKKMGIPTKALRKAHDREVLTNYVGELLQHDTSYHLWSPLVQTKWYLITTIDDHSRRICMGICGTRRPPGPISWLRKPS